MPRLVASGPSTNRVNPYRPASRWGFSYFTIRGCGRQWQLQPSIGLGGISKEQEELMGTIQHDSIIAVTAIDRAWEKLTKWVRSLPPNEQNLFLFGPEVTNGYRTIVLTPDGSKEGWAESYRWKYLRSQFIEKIHGFDYDDGSNPIDFVYVSWGELGPNIVDTNCGEYLP
jgi:hypothetical protein